MRETEVVQSCLEDRELVGQGFGVVGAKSLSMASILIGTDGRVGECAQANSATI